MVDNGDGTITVTCPGSDPVTITNGTDGTDCSVVDNNDGTATINCTDGTSVTISPPKSTVIPAGQPLPGVGVTVTGTSGASNADGSFASGDKVSITFTVALSDGSAIPLEQVDFAAIWISGPTNGYQRVIPADRTKLYLDDVKTKSVKNADGSYTYTFDDAMVSYGAPLWNTTKFTDGVQTGALPNGTYTAVLAFSKNYTVGTQLVKDVGGTTYDFQFGSATATSKEIITQGNCNRCHDNVEGHGGAFKELKACLTCHTPGAEDSNSTDTGDTTPVTIEFKVMLHKLHNGAHLPSVQGITTAADGSRVYGTGTPYVVGSTDFSSIAFPAFPNYSIALPKDSGYSALAQANRTKEDNVRKGVTSCANCHDDPDGAGPLPAPVDGGDAIYAAPKKRVCNSCHDDLDYAKPYVANGATMPADTTEANCSVCHTASSLKTAHIHPILNPSVNPESTIAITGLTGGTGANGNFQAGDPISLSFTIKDSANADLPINTLDSFSLALTGPTNNRQVVIPGTLTASPFDITGRLVSAGSTTGKGLMSKVVPTTAPVSDTFQVRFTSGTHFDVSGFATGVLGGGDFPAATSTPATAAISNIILKPTAPVGAITLTWSDGTNFTVTDGSSNVIGTGTLPAAATVGGPSVVTRFVSGDGSVAFNVTVSGVTAVKPAPVNGNKNLLYVFKGAAANPVMFALVAGGTAFSAGDRFYSDFVAPASSYTIKVPMDLQFEYLGDATGTAGQAFTAANLPVYNGRQSVWEVTANSGSPTTLTTANIVMARYAIVAPIATLASNDFVVIDRGTANEEYARVSAYDGTLNRIQFANPLRYKHAVGTTIQEVTVAAVLEGPGAAEYTLTSATGKVTPNYTATAGHAFFMTYRTDGHFGWKRKAGETLTPFFYAPLQEVPGLDESWGDWRGKSLVDGTYTIAVWGYDNVEYKSGTNEWQTYRGTSQSAQSNFLYGGATTVTPYSYISSDENCNVCHDDLSFHGGGRRGGDTCLMCHATPGPTVHYRTLLHELHAETFPVMPNGAGQCAKCHGENTPVVNGPSSRAHPTQQVIPTHDWTDTCTGCHTSDAAVAHANAQIAPNGAESCVTCHGEGKAEPVASKHVAHLSPPNQVAFLRDLIRPRTAAETPRLLSFHLPMFAAVRRCSPHGKQVW